MSRWAFTIRLYSPFAYCGRLAVVAARTIKLRPTAASVKAPLTSSPAIGESIQKTATGTAHRSFLLEPLDYKMLVGQFLLQSASSLRRAAQLLGYAGWALLHYGGEKLRALRLGRRLALAAESKSSASPHSAQPTPEGQPA